MIDLQARFIEVAESLTAERRDRPGVCGRWSPREVVAHISGWDAEVLRQFEIFGSGYTVEIRHDIDEFNARSVESRADLSWQATVEELRNIHRRYPAAIARVTVLQREPNPQYREWLEVLTDHYRHHTAQLQRWQ
ncbi:MAG TPA: DinB family protein, partial [Thermoanaerobaculia bacterium]|nr:DinB family protein [Thermoanaerobaculia bacterium]